MASRHAPGFFAGKVNTYQPVRLSPFRRAIRKPIPPRGPFEFSVYPKVWIPLGDAVSGPSGRRREMSVRIGESLRLCSTWTAVRRRACTPTLAAICSTSWSARGGTSEHPDAGFRTCRFRRAGSRSHTKKCIRRRKLSCKRSGPAREGTRRNRTQFVYPSGRAHRVCDVRWR